MSQPWQQGSAAREPDYDGASNPYKPVDYAARLQNSPRRRSGQQAQTQYQPGQLYGQPTYAPPVSSPPPAAEPQAEIPAYMQPHSFDPPQLTPGAPYGANAFQDGPKPFGEAAQEQPDFAFTPPWDEPAPQREPEAQTQPEPQPEDDEISLRDPFAPAEEPKPLPRTRTKPQRPPVRIGRVIALIAAAAMIVFCAVVGGSLVADLARTERSLEQARSAYREENGMDLQYGAAKVELLPAGQTFEPTATPAPTTFIPTPSPTPVIPINEAAVLGMSGRVAGETQAETPTPAPALRTRLTSYPKNPLCNIHESLTALVDENADVKGRLVISGVLDEIVVQRNNTYYLTRTYAGINSEAGSVFIDESCSLRMPPENLLLRAQGSVPGKAFAPLWQFVSGGAAFVSAHATATLTTLYEEEQYVLFGVITAQSDPRSPGYFNYASYPTFATDEAMMAYAQSVKANSLYPFNVDVQASDRLLTLATIGGDSAVVLIYRMARDGEYY